MVKITIENLDSGQITELITKEYSIEFKQEVNRYSDGVMWNYLSIPYLGTLTIVARVTPENRIHYSLAD